MPIVDTIQQPPPQPPEQPFKSTAPEYRGVTVDTRYTPRQALLGYVEGSSYTVSYYSQVLDADTGLSGQQTNLSAINQQYRLIRKFELKLTSPLSVSQDSESNAMVVEGTANVYSLLKPNVGDMFLGDIGDGQEGLFQVTDSRRKSVLKDAIHEIDFQLIDYATPERLADLGIKTITTVVFVKDLLAYSQNPFLQVEEYNTLSQLSGYYAEIADMYVKSFLSKEYMTLLVPDQDFTVYDPFITQAVLALFDTYDTPELRYIRKLNCDGDPALKATTIWTALLKRSVMLLSRASQHVGAIRSKLFIRSALLEGVYHSGVQYVAYPFDPERSINSRDLQHVKLPEQIVVRDPLAIATPLIPQAGLTDSYVFTQAFYDDTEGQSKLELLVRDYLEEKALDQTTLATIAKSYPEWAPLDQFYYAPILLLLIKMTIRRQ